MKHKPLARQLTAQFFRGNVPMFALAVFAVLTGGTLNLIVTWLMQQLIDAASGLPGALPLGKLAWITGGFILLCAALMLLKYASEPRFIEKAMRQYKDFAFQKLTEKSISSFRAESTAAYLSALTNDAASIEADDLSQLLSVIMKAVTFFGALAMMLWYSPLITAIAAGVTVLPLIASVLTGGQLQAAEKRVSDQNRDFTAALSDCLGGFSVVKTFRAEKDIFRLFAESNRALDAQTAHQVTDDILSLSGVTRIVVTHTLEQAALRRYDGILVLKDGRIAESGSFDELMEQKGYFYALYTVSQ